VADTHTEGNPTRILLAGLDLPAGLSVPEVRAWLRDEADWVRTRLVHEPRGGALTCAVVPVPGRGPHWDVGAVLLEPGSYPPMCGHCMIGFAATAVELNLVPGASRTGDESRLRILTPAGVVQARVTHPTGSAAQVTLVNVPSYVAAATTWDLPDGQVPIDVTYGGDHYLTIDAAVLGLSLERGEARVITDLAVRARETLAQSGFRDPETGDLLDVYQVMFFRRLDPGTFRLVVVAPPGVIDRSPCGTGSSALVALLVDRGEVLRGQTIVTQSIIGSTFQVCAEAHTDVNGRSAVVPEVTGAAFINSFSTVVADRLDRWRNGFPPL